jgi:hypothetical protein
MDIVKYNMLMTNELINIFKIFESNKIEVIPFKGPTLSYIVYNNITFRQYVDLDIMINESHDKLEIVNILKNLGYKLDNDLNKNTNLNSLDVVSLYNVDKGILLELHWKLLSVNYAINMNKIKLFEEFIYMEINGYKLKTFNLEFLLVYLCVHASKHFFERISWINDIHLLITNKTLNWGKVYHYVKTLDIERIVHTAIYISYLTFKTKIPNEINLTISNDYKSKKIAKKILSLENKSEKLTFKSLLLLLDQRNGVLKKIELVIKLFFYPKETDFQKFNIPKYMNSMFIVIRPFRLILKYLKK